MNDLYWELLCQIKDAFDVITQNMIGRDISKEVLNEISRST
jgi:hypothetical protein